MRFSNGSGNPAAPDAERRRARPGGQFDLPDGTATDIVALTLPVFFVRTPEDFLEFTRARKPDPETGQPDFAKVGPFIEAHPEALPAIQAALGAKAPASYLACTYNGLHAFRLVNAGGEAHVDPLDFEPETPGAGLEPGDAAAREPDYLQADLVERLGEGPAAFTLVAVGRRRATRSTIRPPPGPRTASASRSGASRSPASRRPRAGRRHPRVRPDPGRRRDRVLGRPDPARALWAYSESVLRRTGVERGFSRIGRRRGPDWPLRGTTARTTMCGCAALGYPDDLDRSAPAAVLAIVGDPHQLPLWAPDFAAASSRR